MQLTALGDSFCSKESGSDYWSVSIISEMQNQQMPWLSGLQVVSVEEVGGCRRIIKKIDHVLLYCIVVILLKGAKRDTLGSVGWKCLMIRTDNL